MLSNNGVRVPISSLWRNGAWVGTGVIQQATLARATAQPTRAVDYSVPPTAPVVSPYTCNGLDDLNCSDFNRQWGQAQAHLQMCGDEDNLDGDGDGRAWESIEPHPDPSPKRGEGRKMGTSTELNVIGEG